MPDIDVTAFHDFEQAGWQRAAGWYPDTFGNVTTQSIESLLDAARVSPGTRVLDVATGPGYVAGAAAARGALATGLDFSPSMVEEARRRYPATTFREGDAEALPYGAGSFDVVVMNFGLLHLARPDVAIAEAHRVLASGGRYAFTVWAVPEKAAGFGIVLRALEAHGTASVGLPEGPPFFQFSDPEQCRQSLAKAGFTGIDVKELPLVWRLSSADLLFEAALHGGVRTSAVLQAQTPAALAAIRAAVRADLRSYVDGRAFVVPMTAVLASAVRR
jgi:SAM-dependent methyltransferase